MIICPKCGLEFEPKKLRCTRCKHEWYPKTPNKPPEVCPRCKSPYWNRERMRDLKRAKSTENDDNK